MPGGVKFVHRVVGKDGVVRLYLRKTGCPRVPLQSSEGSPELQAEVDSLVAALAMPKAHVGTLRAAFRAYETESAEYGRLAASTKKLYAPILGEMTEDLGHILISTIKPGLILRWRDMWATRGYQAADHRLQILKNALKPHIIAGDIEADPFTQIARVRRSHDLEEPHAIWSDDDFRAVVTHAHPGLARGVAIGRYVGARREDIVCLTGAARRQGRFAYVSQKRKVPVDIPEPPELTAYLDRLAGSARAVTLAYNKEGLPYTGNGFYQAVRDLVARLAGQGLVSDPSLDVHGLRHTRGVELAIAGLSDAEGAAMLGHRSPHSFAPYRRQADRVRLSDNAAAKLAQRRERLTNAKL
jgi:hypothetical protein